jgi:hypothetical protein
MKNETLEELFVYGVIAIHVINEKQCEIVIDYAKDLGFDVEEIDNKTYIEYPFMFIEDKEQLQANMFRKNIEADGLKVLEFEEAFC